MTSDTALPPGWLPTALRDGNRRMVRTMSDVEARAIPEPNSGCWIWLGAHRGRGYGTIRHHGNTTLAHRLSYELTAGVVIPSGSFVCHRCDNPERGPNNGCLYDAAPEPEKPREGFAVFAKELGSFLTRPFLRQDDAQTWIESTAIPDEFEIVRLIEAPLQESGK